MWFASEVMELVAYSSVSFYHQSCDVCSHYQEPTQYSWVCHPADELVQLTISYALDFKNMTSISSDKNFIINSKFEDVWNVIISTSLACVQSSNFLRSLVNSSDDDFHLETWPAEVISSISSPPTSEGVAKSSSSCEHHMRMEALHLIHFFS